MRKGYVVLLALCVGAAMAAVVDRAPAGATPAPGDYPAWGQLIRSFSISQMTSGYPGGIACTNDGYVIVGHWGSSFTAWYVYTTAGSYVQSVPVSGMTSYGFRGGSGKCHLGSGYFVGAHVSGGVRAWPYSAGGNPGTTYTVVIASAQGRGVAWDGTYYYATTGTYGTPIGIYTTAGSQVGTVPGSVYNAGVYDYATPVSGNGYIYVGTQSPLTIIEVSLATGSYVRTISGVPSFPAGTDFGWSDGYIYTAIQASPGQIYVYDGPGFSSVVPASLGKIKAVYR